MIPTSFKSHVKKSNHNIKNLLSTGRDNPTIISIIIVETYFRSSSVRILEAIIYLLGIKKNITIGMNQLNASFWEKFLANSKIIFIYKVLYGYEDNYDAIKYYFDTQTIEFNNLYEVAKYYNGPSHSSDYFTVRTTPTRV